MIEKKKTRHFHAGKLRKTVGGIEFVEVAESNGKVFVSEDGRIITAHKPTPWLGSIDPSTGYVKISVANKSAYVHRIVFEVLTGTEIPDDREIDHIDATRTNNRLSNLRIVTKVENCQNPITAERRATALAKLIAAARRTWETDRDRMLRKALENIRRAQDKWRTAPDEMRSYLQKAIDGNKKKVVAVNVATGVSVGPFETMTEASRATGVHLSDISYAASGKLKTAGGYVWKVVKYV